MFRMRARATATAAGTDEVGIRQDRRRAALGILRPVQCPDAAVPGSDGGINSKCSAERIVSQLSKRIPFR